MKLTNKQLKQIIKEELEAVMEGWFDTSSPIATADAKFDKKQSRERSIESIKGRTVRYADRRLTDILAEKGIFGDDIANMMKENPIQFEGNKFYKLEDLTEAVVESTYKSLGKDSIKMGDDKELAGSIAVDIFKLIRPLVNKNRSFMQKAGSFLTGKGFKQ